MERSMTKITAIALGALAGLVFGPGANAADYEAGKKKAAEICAACHGPEGNKPITPDTPILAGQHADYLQMALRQYSKGERTNPMMSPMAKPLTKAEIADLALYFSKQKGLVHKY
jgi:cytochrome c553